MKMFKKFLSLACIVAICLSAALPAAMATESGSTMYVTANEYVNMRSEPTSQTDNVIIQIPTNAAVTVIAIENGWAEVTYNEKTGFVYAAYLSKKNPNPSSMWVETGKSSGLNFRTAPNGDLIDELPNGTQVSVYYVEDGWACVSVNGTEGFVYAAYLTSEDPSAAPLPETPTPGSDTVAYVKNDDTALLAEPKADSTVLGTYDADTQVTVIFETSTGWARVYVDGQIGYMPTAALTDAIPEEDEEGDQPTAPSTPSEYTLMKVKGGNLAFRSAPEKKSNNIICFYKTGTEVKVYATSNGWAQVAVDSQIGYMMASYLEAVKTEEELPDEGDQPAEPSLPSEFTLMKVKGGNLAFRSAPEKKSNNIICFHKTGTEVKVYAVNNGWAQVSVNGQIGYMMAAYLEAVITEENQPGEDEGEGNQPAEPALPSEFTLMKVKGGNLAFRSAPEKKSNNIICFLKTGTEVKVYTVNNGWAQVSVNGEIGYMMTAYLEAVITEEDQPGEGVGEETVPDEGEENIPDEGGENDVDPVPTTKTVTHPKGSFVNFRSSATDTTDTNILGKIPSGTTVEVVSAGKLFTKIIYNGTTGYINSNYLK